MSKLNLACKLVLHLHLLRISCSFVLLPFSELFFPNLGSRNLWGFGAIFMGQIEARICATSSTVIPCQFHAWAPRILRFPQKWLSVFLRLLDKRKDVGFWAITCYAIIPKCGCGTHDFLLLSLAGRLLGRHSEIHQSLYVQTIGSSWMCTKRELNYLGLDSSRYGWKWWESSRTDLGFWWRGQECKRRRLVQWLGVKT